MQFICQVCNEMWKPGHPHPLPANGKLAYDVLIGADIKPECAGRKNPDGTVTIFTRKPVKSA